jgi:hydroxyacylglutathione hydrolase
MTHIETFVFNPFQENTYLLYDETKECILIDPGCYTPEEKETLTGFINNNQLKLIKVVNTHCHIDHILGISFVVDQFGIPFEAGKEDEFLLVNAVEYGKMFGLDIENPPVISRYLVEGEELRFGNTSLKLLNVPGHSPGSFALYSEKDGFVITGDVLFSGSIGRTDLPGGDYETLISSIKSKLLPMEDEIIVYPGHGPATSIGMERRTNPFLTN